MQLSSSKKLTIATIALVLTLAAISSANATHSWGNYHWARTANPLSLKLGDNLAASWDQYLTVASTDWSSSIVLKTNVVPGQSNPKNCRATLGRIEVCNSRYGNNGWLGIASVWTNGSHIVQATTKVNDTYFNTAPYNTSAWKQFVLCQEVGHAFGLDHQDENFNNANLGTCMDYTNDPSTNKHPNTHDYEMLETIYAHLDSTNTAIQSVNTRGVSDLIDHNDPGTWGKSLRNSSDGKPSLYVRDLGKGQKVITHVIWAE